MDEHTKILQRMTPAAKLDAAWRLYCSAISLKDAAIRKQHPELSETEVRELTKKFFHDSK